MSSDDHFNVVTRDVGRGKGYGPTVGGAVIGSIAGAAIAGALGELTLHSMRCHDIACIGSFFEVLAIGLGGALIGGGYGACVALRRGGYEHAGLTGELIPLLGLLFGVALLFLGDLVGYLTQGLLDALGPLIVVASIALLPIVARRLALRLKRR